ncbi:hypothetical protein LEP1GSC151_2641 [Leptospira interrogans serovar Grippotyphosa str. LT2186]|uniref:Uncharacterized protein n=6 Tax=Leptospira interrogans TaxID=173 RepID=M6ZME6_LEPIR|nr:hypothetical protein G436_2747 [Leptospira interrogans serovar Hardjo str. Norma]EJP16377.1 hypothetical protein LEP1GSC080_0609 [Leptospira interrogans str. FPW2026]EKO05083.1 hypothetical protein LEP1GSC077_1103 [Leptospira interrogans str. C10069]EKO27184.1 hypothetical protein LEP1GSC104_2913 [Leptospira interrogans str. UI 12621]EKO98240.1 hypothetical protein LEP1GSC057_3167 [Leptospira interrogans str. Brem 329]EKR16439.1 hypothetical protein LEP1GSC019_2566 [Leptospira interrogans s
MEFFNNSILFLKYSNEILEKIVNHTIDRFRSNTTVYRRFKNEILHSRFFRQFLSY